MNFDERLARATEAANAAYDAVMVQHSNYAIYKSTTCKCGREFTQTSGLGLHLKAVSKQAGDAFSAAFLPIMNER